MTTTPPVLTSFSQFAPLLIQSYESYLPTAFDDNMTLLQKVNKVINSLNSLGTNFNSIVDQWNTAIAWVEGDGLTQDVSDKLDAMVTDGTLTALINTTLFDQLSTQINSYGLRLSDYGVKGDGVTDDSTAIQNAINDAISKKRSALIVSEGKYYVKTSIQTKGIKLIGVGTPVIPFMTWDYASPYGTVQGFQTYLQQTQGAIFATDQDISIFTDGLIADNIGLMGNRRGSVSNIGVSSSDASKPVITNNVLIQGFGGHGVSLQYGCYQFDLEKTKILQNGVNGVNFNTNNGSGTGESNLLRIRDSFIERNEKDGIAGKVKGRSIVIKNTGFENNSEPSDTSRTKGTSSANLVYGVNLELHDSGGMNNGSIVVEECYSEATYGFIKLNAIDPVSAVTIRDNFWQPLDQTNYSNFVSLNGWIYGVEVKNNNTYTTHDSVLFETGNTVQNVDIDCAYTGTISGNVKPNKETASDGNGKVFMNFNSNAVQSVHNFGSSIVTGFTYDSASNSTYLNIDPTKISGTLWNGYDMGPDTGNIHVGQVVKVGGVYLGVITGVSSTNHLLIVRNDRSSFTLGNGSLELIRVGGFTTVNGAGQPCKMVVDYDGTVLGIGS